MFLSNRPTLFVITSILVLFHVSCGSGPTNSNTGAIVLNAGEGRFPFSTIEPEVFQANFVVTADGSEKRWFLARSNDRWRFDIFKGGERSLTQLRTDKMYLIDHVSRIFAEEPQSTGIFEPPDPILSGFFRGTEYHEFEDLGIEGGLRKYRLKPGDNSKNEIIIMVDELSGMIVKQDFYEGADEQAGIVVTYEVRDLKLIVEDNVFDLPADFKRVDYDEFQRQSLRNRDK